MESDSPVRFFLASLCLLLSCITVTAAEIDAPGKGLLWRVEGQGAPPSYLFGTMHSSDPEVLDLPPAVLDAFEASTLVAGELLMKEIDYAAMLQASLLPQGQTLADLLPPALHQATLKALQELGLPAYLADRMQVWFITLMLAQDPEELVRQQQGVAVLDQWLQEEAERRGKRVAALETLDEQLALFQDWPLSLQVAMLRTLVAYPQLRLGSQAALLALYKDGDLASMWRMFRVSLISVSEQYRELLVGALILRRNHLMDERMQPLLQEGGAFIAVGALHLAGEEGLVVLLRQRGWTVTRAD